MGNWDGDLIKCYEHAANFSTDPSTQNAALIIPGGSDRRHITAANHFPLGVKETPERWERPAKYYYVEHAERNAIYAAARVGVSTIGATMICPWAACASCARAIIQAGISILVRHRTNPENTHKRWDDTIIAGDAMMYEAGVRIVEANPIPGYKLLRDEKIRDTGEL